MDHLSGERTSALRGRNVQRQIFGISSFFTVIHFPHLKLPGSGTKLLVINAALRLRTSDSAVAAEGTRSNFAAVCTSPEGRTSAETLGSKVGETAITDGGILNDSRSSANVPRCGGLVGI